MASGPVRDEGYKTLDAQLIGLDVGTTSCKAGLFDNRGQLLALASAPYPVSRPRPGWVEQDPERYWSAAVQCLRELLARPAARAADLAALSSCGQTPTMLLLDEAGQPLRPAILWQDTRAMVEAERLAADPGTDALALLMDLRWPVDASLPLARLLWLREHEPHVLRRAAVTLQPKDFVHYRLTGRAATDPWSAKGLVHQSRLVPMDSFEALCGTPPTIVPECRSSRSVMGHVSAEGAAATGLPQGLPIATGWTDALAAMLGTGALARPGLACDVSGTSEVIGLTLPGRPHDAGALMVAPIVDSGRWMLYGPTQASGGSLAWAMRSFGAGMDLDEALAAAAATPPGADGLVFLPYLEGERAPLWDPRARGAFVGLSSSHERGHALRAVLEGVACSVRHILSTAESLAGTTAEEMRLAGGGARIAAWNGIKADVLQRPVRACATTENGVLGAAMLAALGAGMYADVAEASDAMVAVQEPEWPRLDRASVYDRLFERYTALYPRLKDLFTS